MRPVGDTPAVRKGVHKEKSATRFAISCRVLEPWKAVTACVGDLDAEPVADDVEKQPEVATGDASVGGGVRGELGDYLCRRFQR
jgi:hypothetical protein